MTCPYCVCVSGGIHLDCAGRSSWCHLDREPELSSGRQQNSDSGERRPNSHGSLLQGDITTSARPSVRHVSVSRVQDCKDCCEFNVKTESYRRSKVRLCPASRLSLSPTTSTTLPQPRCPGMGWCSWAPRCSAGAQSCRPGYRSYQNSRLTLWNSASTPATRWAWNWKTMSFRLSVSQGFIYL